MTQTNTTNHSRSILGYPPKPFVALLLAAAALLVALGSWLARPQPRKTSEITMPPASPLTIPTAQAATSAPSVLSQTKIAEHPVENSKMTAVLIPQTHRQPGSEPGDAANDRAVAAQRSIARLLPELENKYETKLVMVEGEPTGPVSQKKIAALSDRLQALDDLRRLQKELERKISDLEINPANARPVIKLIDREIAAAERSIFLQGAALKLHAEQGGLQLVGAERPETLARSAELVRKYLYVEDRLTQLSSANEKTTAGTLASRDLALLAQLLQSNDNSSPLDDLARQGHDPSLTALTQEIKQTINELHADASDETERTAPSREDNPYRDTTDKRRLERIKRETEIEIDKLVLEQRTQEASDLFAEALENSGESSGIIIFGAGHTESFIRALNERGVTVIVADPNG